MATESIISKVWGFRTMFRDDDGGYGDCLEVPTYLIFLKKCPMKKTLAARQALGRMRCRTTPVESFGKQVELPL